MSEFTRFDNDMHISFDAAASKLLNKNHWRVQQGFRYYIGHLGSNVWVDVPAGKLTDGASVPFPVNALIPAWGSYGQAVALHDQLCDTYYVKEMVAGVVSTRWITRKEIDAILREAMEVLKVEVWRRETIMVGVNAYRILTRPTKPKISQLKLNLEANFKPQPAFEVKS